MIEIPHGMDYLVKCGIVDSLLKAVQDDTTDVNSKEIAVQWLQTFSSYAGFILFSLFLTNITDGRKLILKQIDGVIKYIKNDASPLSFKCATLFFKLAQNKGLLDRYS